MDIQPPQLQKKKKFNFTRLLIIFLGIVIIGLIVSSFVFSNEKFTLSTEIIICLLLLVVLSLSEEFNSFSIGKIFTLQKEADTANRNLKEVREENITLRQQFLAQFNATAKQSNMQNLFFQTPAAQAFGIEKASPETQSEDQKIEENQKNKHLTEKRRKFLQNFGDFLFKTEQEILPFKQGKIYTDVQFKTEMLGIDPIMDKNVKIDGYYLDDDQEIFIKIARGSTMFHYVYELYYIINKIFLYNTYDQTSGRKATLWLIVPNFLNPEEKRTYCSIDTLKDSFLPAMKNKLLDMKILDIDDALYNKIANLKDII